MTGKVKAGKHVEIKRVKSCKSTRAHPTKNASLYMPDPSLESSTKVTSSLIDSCIQYDFFQINDDQECRRHSSRVVFAVTHLIRQPLHWPSRSCFPLESYTMRPTLRGCLRSILEPGRLLLLTNLKRVRQLAVPHSVNAICG